MKQFHYLLFLYVESEKLTIGNFAYNRFLVLKRKKLKLIKSNVKIKAIRGIGYKLEAENDKKIK